MDTVRQVVSDLSIFLYSGVIHLPFTLAGTFLVLGLFTANYAMLFFLVGFLLLVPLTHWGLEMLFFLSNLETRLPSLFSPAGDVCRVVVPFVNDSPPQRQVMSQWMAMVAFFFVYLLRNATALYSRDPGPATAMEVTEKKVTDWQQGTSVRKSQSIMSMGSIAIAVALLLLMRYRTGCESVFGMMLAMVLFGTLGYFWYNALRSAKQDCLSDLFGIANRLLPPSAIVNAPIACLPVKV